MSTRASNGDTPRTPREPAAATLPGTNVSASSWAQFQRRMRLRRETTCVAALRRAMDAGDYLTALERAKELTAIDAGWNDVRLFLEAKVAAASSPLPAVPSPPVSLRSRGRVVLGAALILAFATAAGWAMAHFAPAGMLAGWIESASASPSPAAATETTPVVPSDDVPELPLSSIAPPLPLPGDAVRGNAVSQNRYPAAPRSGPEPLSSSSAPGAASRPDTAGEDTQAPSSPAAALRPRPSSVLPQTAAAAPIVPRPPLVAPDTTTEIRTPAARPEQEVSRPSETRAVPATSTSRETTATPPPTTTAAPPPSAASPESIFPAASGSLPSVRPLPPGTSAGTAPGTDADARGVPAVGSGPAPGATATAGEAGRDADERMIVAALGSYARGYTDLNAAAVRRVWPTVNEDALRNAFGQLRSQRVTFAACTIDVQGLHASARCRGSARYLPKVGSGDTISTTHVWQFGLRKVVEEWVIESATIR